MRSQTTPVSPRRQVFDRVSTGANGRLRIGLEMAHQAGILGPGACNHSNQEQAATLDPGRSRGRNAPTPGLTVDAGPRRPLDHNNQERRRPKRRWGTSSRGSATIANKSDTAALSRFVRFPLAASAIT
jgi:hypothetical protein